MGDTVPFHPPKGKHRKHFIPLESNPEVFTQLIHNLGVSSSLAFVDVLSLDDPDLLSFIPRPVFALVLVVPDSPTYTAEIVKEERPEYAGFGAEEDVVFFKQTISNACGLYATLHGTCNGGARDFIIPESTLARLVASSIPLQHEERALHVEASSEIEQAHSSAALQGQSAPPSALEEPSFRYMCFTKSHKNGHLYHLEGALKGPVDLGPLLKQDQDLLSEPALDVVRGFVQREDGNPNFSLMALVRTPI